MTDQEIIENLKKLSTFRGLDDKPDNTYLAAAERIMVLGEAIDEIAKEEDGGYGFYLGGDPRKFYPDAESCTPEELAAHKAACEKWDEAEAKGEKLEPDPCGSGWISPTVHVTRSAYGLGSYTFPTHAARLAQAARAATDPRGGGLHASLRGLEPTPPATTAEMTDAMLAERVWSGDRWTYPNLASLRAKLADQINLNIVATATILDREAKLAEAEGHITSIMRTLGVVTDWKEAGVGPDTLAVAAWQAMNVREIDLEAKLAEWEAAGRVLAKYIYENGRGCGTRTAIEREDDLKIHRGNLYANPIASRLVAEAGGTNG